MIQNNELAKRRVEFQKNLGSKKFSDYMVSYYSEDSFESLKAFVYENVIIEEPRRFTDTSFKSGKIMLNPFDRQLEYFHWLYNLYKNQKEGVVEKSRDVGASWCSVAFFVWCFLYQKDIAFAMYSYKQGAVDRAGHAGTLFGKARYILENIHPSLLMNFDMNKHSKLMLINHPKNENRLFGLSGESPRSDRAGAMLLDESAFYTHPDTVEGAVSHIAKCRIQVSTHNGASTLFKRKCEGALGGSDVELFIFDWRDNPTHTLEWYEERKNKAIIEGTLSIFAQEVERNPNISNNSTVIVYEWLDSVFAYGLEKKDSREPIVAGLDLAGGGRDKTAIAIRQGSFLIAIEESQQESNKDFLSQMILKYSIDVVIYDALGLGFEFRTIAKDSFPNIKFIAFQSSGSVERKGAVEFGDKSNEKMFANRKAQVYFEMRKRFSLTYHYVVGKNKVDSKKMIGFSQDLKMNKTFINQLMQPTYKQDNNGKIVVDKAPNDAKSPDMVDALVMAFSYTPLTESFVIN